MNGIHWTIARMTQVQIWRSRAPRLIAASVFLSLMLPLYFSDARTSSPKMFLYVQTAGLFASVCVLWFVALNLLAAERAQRSIPMVTTRPISMLTYLSGRCLGVLLLYSQCFAAVSLMLVLAKLFGRADVTLACVAFWCLYFVNSAAHIIVAVAAGALCAPGAAFFLQALFYLFVEMFPLYFFGVHHWLLNTVAHVAFYLAPYNPPSSQMASLNLAEPLAAQTITWMIFSGLDHLLYGSCLLFVTGLVFRARNEQLTAGK